MRGHDDDGNARGYMFDELKKFRCAAGVCDHDDGVVGADDTQVAVEGF